MVRTSGPGDIVLLISSENPRKMVTKRVPRMKGDVVTYLIDAWKSESSKTVMPAPSAPLACVPSHMVAWHASTLSCQIAFTQHGNAICPRTNAPLVFVGKSI
ncbi:hypothetical protein GUJ93_ZPchr0002g24624 [Zizania palustris]|uniref:Uncharacterized protein n=1 Tax=Zizania palustris TaxID=103762 RepID=A0A8J5RIR8_ZIZPA|nr:hypothetical protein GUJ93_ZPchr0002g24624 [Zizania palustris]